MSAGRGDFERSARAALADHVAHVGHGRRRELCEVGCGDRIEARFRRVGQMSAQRRQIARAIHIYAGYERSLGCACGRQIELRIAVRRRARGHAFSSGRVARCRAARGAARHRESAAHGTQCARQRQLAGELTMKQRFHGNLAACRENPQRDRQIDVFGVFITVRSMISV